MVLMETLESLENLSMESAKILDKLHVIEVKVDTLTEMLASLLRDKSKAAEPPLVGTVPLPPRHMEFPPFDASDPLTWISRAEQYFRVYQVKETAKVGIALLAMNGVAFNWVNWTVRQRPNMCWAELKYELQSLFGEDPTATSFEALIRTKQTGNVDNYINAFVSRAVHVEGLSDTQVMGLFIHGLREEIRIRIRAEDATDIVTTMRLAREIEHRVHRVITQQHIRR